MKTLQQQLVLARKRYAQAEFRLNYLERVVQFRKVSLDYCLRLHLCTTSAEGGTLHCAQPASFVWDTKNGKGYACSQCSMNAPQKPTSFRTVEEEEKHAAEKN
jgi:hypothetical protein